MHPYFLLEACVFYFFIVNVNNKVECSTYIGCFKEKSAIDRLFKGDHVDFRNTLTPSKCISHCAGKGFAYAGLQYKFECFCSNERPSHKSVANEGECDMRCDGNSREICGGGLRLSVYSVSGEGNGKYIGCYKERSKEARLMPEEFKEFPNILTPARCITFCKQKGYDYAGLQQSFQCFCSNQRPSFKSSADENNCNLRCEGDSNQICGGGFRLSVYETTDLLTNFVQSTYVGCYAHDGDGRLVASKYTTFSKILTPELCVGFCYRNGNRYAGLQNRSHCYCGDYTDDKYKVSDSECNDQCLNSRFKCGGQGRFSAYHTQISDYSEDGRLVGCFIDNVELRVLSALQMKFEETNTPTLCFNVCFQLGFKFSGVENGVECYCGNRRPERNYEVGENHCGRRCPGNRNKYCGGELRVLVHEINASSFSNFATPATTKRPSLTTIRPAQTQRPYLQPSHSQVTQRPTTQRPQQQNNKKPFQPTTSESSAVMLSSNFETANKNSNKNRKPGNNCVKSFTEVNRKSACKGDLLFKDNFENAISSERWTFETKMPWIPDYEFVVMQKKPQNSFVKNGKLHIKPTLLEDEFVRKGRLELNSCTGMPHSEECVRQAATFSILPPIESARITTKDSISFKYGIIQVRAKLPMGDWIVPEIWLEPKRRAYGPSYASGRIRIAMARGNRNLMSGDMDIGTTKLESGILIGVGENIRGRTIIRDKIDGWYKHFHNYTLIWTPDDLKFLVDGQHEQSIMSEGTTLADLVGFDESTLITWRQGTKIAPFDQEFYLSLGVTVGGMRDFPDESLSSGHEKPWRNMAVKAMLNFWQDRHHWFSTWDDDRSALQIEHVRIQAL